jgi:hypothetical protein
MYTPSVPALSRTTLCLILHRLIWCEYNSVSFSTTKLFPKLFNLDCELDQGQLRLVSLQYPVGRPIQLTNFPVVLYFHHGTLPRYV